MRIQALSLTLVVIVSMLANAASAPSAVTIPRVDFQTLYHTTYESGTTSSEGAIGLTLGVELVEEVYDNLHSKDKVSLRASLLANSRGLKQYSVWDQSGTPSRSAVPTEWTLGGVAGDDEGRDVEVNDFVEQCWPSMVGDFHRIGLYGVFYQKFWVSTNGFLYFLLEGIERPVDWKYYWAGPIPSRAGPQAFVAPFWTDLSVSMEFPVKLYCYYANTGAWDNGYNIGVLWEAAYDTKYRPNRFAVQFNTAGMSLGNWNYQIHFLYWTVYGQDKVDIGLEDEAGSRGGRWTGVYSNHVLHWTNEGDDYSLARLAVYVRKPDQERYQSQLEIAYDKENELEQVAGVNVATENPERKWGDLFSLALDAALLAFGEIPSIGTPVILLDIGILVLDAIGLGYHPPEPVQMKTLSPPEEADGYVYASLKVEDERDVGRTTPVFCESVSLESCATDASMAIGIEWFLWDDERDRDHVIDFYAVATYASNLDSSTKQVGTHYRFNVKHMISGPIENFRVQWFAHNAVLRWNQYDPFGQWGDFNGYDIFYRSNRPGDRSEYTYHTSLYDKYSVVYLFTGLQSDWPYCFRMVKSSVVCGRTLVGDPIQHPSPGGTPYLGVWNGSAYARENNLLSLAHDYRRASREVKDYLLLSQEPVATEEGLRFRITAEGREAVVFDQSSLIALDHPPSVGLTVSDDGRVTSFGSLVDPIAATDESGFSVLSFVNRDDGEEWPMSPGSWVDVTFNKASLNYTSGADIIIMCRQQCDKMGEPPYPDSVPVRFQGSVPAGPWHVFGQGDNGSWALAEELVPRMYESRYAANLSAFLTEPMAGNFTIRIGSTSFHLLDYVGVDNTIPVPPVNRTYTLLNATLSTGANITSNLSADDGSNVVVNPGEWIDVIYGGVSEPEPGNTRDYVFETRGYFYPLFTEPDVFQPVQTVLSLNGTLGSNVTAQILAGTDSGYEAWNQVTLERLAGQGGQPGGPPDSTAFTFNAYANRSYYVELVYLANGSQSYNALAMQLLFGSQNLTLTEAFNGSRGPIQRRLVDLNPYLNATLEATPSGILIRSNETATFEPLNLLADGHLMRWHNVTWDFGDGTYASTTNRTAVKTYDTVGNYVLSASVIYETFSGFVARTMSVQIEVMEET